MRRVEYGRIRLDSKRYTANLAKISWLFVSFGEQEQSQRNRGMISYYAS